MSTPPACQPSASKEYEDVVVLDDIDTSTQHESLFGPSSLSSPSDTQLPPTHPDTTDPARRRKRWTSSLTRWRSPADVSLLVQQGVGWAQSQMRQQETQMRQRVANTVAGTSEAYTAAQMAATRGLDQLITSLDEGLFIDKETTSQAACPAHRDSDGQCDHRWLEQSSYVSKVNLYNNSRLPADLPPLRM